MNVTMNPIDHNTGTEPNAPAVYRDSVRFTLICGT
jgi:hypothetical protein